MIGNLLESGVKFDQIPELLIQNTQAEILAVFNNEISERLDKAKAGLEGSKSTLKRQ